MSKAKNKTSENEQNPVEFLHQVDNTKRREDAFKMMEIMEEVVGEPPKMWGPSIVGFGRYKYKYKSGREAEWMLTGFSPRKTALTLYIMDGFEAHDELLSRLGKYKTGKACLYIKRLADVDEAVLRELVKISAEHMRASDIDNQA